MGKCNYCGHDAGFFSSQHSACVEKHKQGWTSITTETDKFLRIIATKSDSDILNFKREIEMKAQESFVRLDEMRSCVADSWVNAATAAKEEKTMPVGTGRSLLLFAEQFKLTKAIGYRVSTLRKLKETLEKETLQGQLYRIVSIVDGFQARSPILAWSTDDIKRVIEDIAKVTYASKTHLRPSVVSSWDQAVTNAVEREILLERTANILVYFAEQFELGKTDSDCSSTWGKLDTRIALEAPGWTQKQDKYGAIIDALKSGTPIELVVSKLEHPFKLQKSETLVWTFDEAVYFEEALSDRRYKYSAPNRMARKDLGKMGLTTKHIYFVGTTEVFRIRYDRIGAYHRHQDGVIVTRYAATARPQLFVTGEDFTYGLVTALAKVY